MERKLVESSNLTSVGYDNKENILEIKFHSGNIYQYSGVSKTVFEGLMNAASKGTYHHRFIKNSYPFVRIV